MKKLLATILVLLVGTAFIASAIPSKSSSSVAKKKTTEISVLLKELPGSKKIEEEKDPSPIKIETKVFTEEKKTKEGEELTKGTGSTQKEIRTLTISGISASVPDGGPTVAFLGMALIGLVISRRILRRVRA